MPTVCHKGAQWQDPDPVDHMYAKSCPPAREIYAQGRRCLNKADIHFYTGLRPDVFDILVSAMPLYVTTKFVMPQRDQLLLTLMKFRLGLVYRDLARRFETSVSTVGNIFRATLGALTKMLRNVVVWLSTDTIQRNVPNSFRESGYGGTTCILDCTEVFLQRPKKLLARAQTYSSYKGHNTIKFLVAIAPHGTVMFVSKAYGGRASDKFIVRDSWIIRLFKRGDRIMADRGFSLEPEMEAKDISLTVPSFTRGR